MTKAKPMPIFDSVIVCRFCSLPLDAQKDFYSDVMRRQSKCKFCCRQYQKDLAKQNKMWVRNPNKITIMSDFSTVQKLENIAYENAKAKKHPLFDISNMITETMEILNTHK